MCLLFSILNSILFCNQQYCVCQNNKIDISNISICLPECMLCILGKNKCSFFFIEKENKKKNV